MDYTKMLRKSQELQWSIDEVDWDAPGKPQPEDVAHLKGLMGDLAWIEHIAHPAFSALEHHAQDPELKQIYKYFQIDEERHSKAEVGMMRRWGMHKGDGMPDASHSIRLLQESALKVAWQLHPSVLVAVIPMLELVLDGGLVKSLSNQVKDPLFHHVFYKINADESRHLIIDFHALEADGLERGETSIFDVAKMGLQSVMHIEVMRALFLGFMPYMAQAHQSLLGAGVEWNLVRAAFQRYIQLGYENKAIGSSPAYQVFKMYAWKLENGHHVIENLLLSLSDAMAAVQKPWGMFSRN